MGIYSKEGQKAYLESDRILTKASEDYYKSKMFYGNVQVYIDASNEQEAKQFAARAINDFDTFCKCYTPNNGDKLNGIIVKPVGEMSNEFVACCTTLDGGRSFEHIIIREGQVKEVAKKVLTTTKDVAAKTVDKSKEMVKAAKEKISSNKEPKEEEVKESVNLARDF